MVSVEGSAYIYDDVHAKLCRRHRRVLYLQTRVRVEVIQRVAAISIYITTQYIILLCFWSWFLLADFAPATHQNNKTT